MRSPFGREQSVGDLGAGDESGSAGSGGKSVVRDEFEHVPAGAAAEDDEVDQRVGAQPIGAVDGDAGDLAGGVEAGIDRRRRRRG